MLALVLVAIASAGFAIVFRGSLSAVFHGVAGAKNVVDAMASASWWWRLAIPMLGAFAAGAVSLLIAKRRGGGVGDVMEAVALGSVRISLPVTIVKSLASWCAIVCGGSLGREGPLIQFGGASADEASRRFGLHPDDRRVLIAAGTAAGFAAAYNTPLAAVAFVLEIVTGIVVVDTIVPTLVATVIATTLTRLAVGTGPIYGTRIFVLTQPSELFAYAAVGVVSCLCAFGFTRLVAVAEDVFHRPWLKPPLRQALGGLGAGAIIVFVPAVAGNGYEPLNSVLDGTTTLSLVAILLFAKAVATSASVGAGNPGGIFTPTLLIGGCSGYLFGTALGAAGLHVGPPGGYALVGMASAIAAATHAPLMGAVLAFELSGDYAVVLPLVLATAIATALARTLGRDSIYMAEVRERGVSWQVTISSQEQQDRK